MVFNHKINLNKMDKIESLGFSSWKEIILHGQKPLIGKKCLLRDLITKIFQRLLIFQALGLNIKYKR